MVALALSLLALVAWVAAVSRAQSIDRTQNPNVANAGIARSLAQESGGGRGNILTPDSSAFIIARDPFRAPVAGRPRGHLGLPELADHLPARRHRLESRSGQPQRQNFPQSGHGSIKLTTLFNDPSDPD